MEVLYHIRPYLTVHSPYIGLKQMVDTRGTSNLQRFRTASMDIEFHSIAVESPGLRFLKILQVHVQRRQVGKAHVQGRVHAHSLAVTLDGCCNIIQRPWNVMRAAAMDMVATLRTSKQFVNGCYSTMPKNISKKGQQLLE